MGSRIVPDQMACCGEMTALVAGGMAVDAIGPYFSFFFFFATISHSILVARLVRCGLVVRGSVLGLAQFNIFTSEVGKGQSTSVTSSRWCSGSCQSFQALLQEWSQLTYL